MKALIACYSRTGNNDYLAKKITNDLNGDLLKIEPRSKSLIGLIFSTVTGISRGIRDSQKNLNEYDAVVLCGPIWMGKLVSPLRDFLRKYKPQIKKLYFITCCGGGDTEKDTRFGYNGVFSKVKDLLGDQLIDTIAIPIDLVTPDELKGNSEAVMKIRLTDETFNSKAMERYTGFLRTIK